MKIYKVSTNYTYCLYEFPGDAIQELITLISHLTNKVTLETVEMTKEEFEQFDEFTGW